MNIRFDKTIVVNFWTIMSVLGSLCGILVYINGYLNKQVLLEFRVDELKYANKEQGQQNDKQFERMEHELEELRRRIR